MTIQSIIFAKSKWSQARAEKWLKSKGYKITFHGKPVDETANFYRYRQARPNPAMHYFTKTLPGQGIKFIIKYPAA
jgi:hypothetical protein